jgi:hypothetical protein
VYRHLRRVRHDPPGRKPPQHANKLLLNLPSPHQLARGIVPGQPTARAPVPFAGRPPPRHPPVPPLRHLARAARSSRHRPAPPARSPRAARVPVPFAGRPSLRHRPVPPACPSPSPAARPCAIARGGPSPRRPLPRRLRARPRVATAPAPASPVLRPSPAPSAPARPRCPFPRRPRAPPRATHATEIVLNSPLITRLPQTSLTPGRRPADDVSWIRRLTYTGFESDSVRNRPLYPRQIRYKWR